MLCRLLEDNRPVYRPMTGRWTVHYDGLIAHLDEISTKALVDGAAEDNVRKFGHAMWLLG